MKTPDDSRVRRVSIALSAAAVAASVGISTATATDCQAIDQVERYCAASWRNAGIHPQDWRDCTQEAIARLLERVPQDRLEATLHDSECPERRELKRAIWRTIQRWRRATRPGSIDGQQFADEHDEFETMEQRDSLDVALRNCSARQQRILSLWSDGYSIDEIARRLAISAARASDEKYKAIRKLQRAMGTST